MGGDGGWISPGASFCPGYADRALRRVPRPQAIGVRERRCGAEARREERRARMELYRIDEKGLAEAMARLIAEYRVVAPVEKGPRHVFDDIQDWSEARPCLLYTSRCV